MRLNLTRLRTSGAARRSALRAPSALRAAARRSFVTNMKITPHFHTPSPQCELYAEQVLAQSPGRLAAARAPLFLVLDGKFISAAATR